MTTCNTKQGLPHSGPTRRDLLKGLGGFGLAAASKSAFSIPDQAAAEQSHAPAIPPVKVVPIAIPLRHQDVALTESPFLRARERTRDYLLSLNADRLLHSFRVNAGLLPKAPAYGGWESAPFWTDIHCQGHTLGHYLSGCALMFSSTGDARFKERCDYIITELSECQAAAKTGLLTAFPEGNALMDEVIAGRKYTGVPWYTLHKVYAGIRDVVLYVASASAREVLIRYADWAVGATASLTEPEFQKMLDEEHGGMNEILADVYELTGDIRYLALSKKFCHHSVLAPLAKSCDVLDGMHANTQIPKVIGFSRIFQLTGEERYLNASSFFWRTVVNTRSFVNGNHGDGEHFFPVADFEKHVFSARASETCCDYNMLKLTRELFKIRPSAHYADFYECALYNDILASQDPDTGMVTYFQGNRPGYMKLYCTPLDSFWCCTGTGMENHAKYNESIYFKGDNCIYVNLFVPSVARLGPTTSIAQTNHLPEEERTTLKWKMEQPLKITVKLRHPSWCAAATVIINGEPVLQSRRPSSYIELNRVWHDGDVIELELPMNLHAVSLPGVPNIVAFKYGPIVLAGDLGNSGIAQGLDLIESERRYGKALETSTTVPTLTGTPDSLLRSALRTGTDIAFTLPASGDAPEVRLVPYYAISHRHYVTYWDIASPAIKMFQV